MLGKNTTLVLQAKLSSVFMFLILTGSCAKKTLHKHLIQVQKQGKTYFSFFQNVTLCIKFYLWDNYTLYKTPGF